MGYLCFFAPSTAPSGIVYFDKVDKIYIISILSNACVRKVDSIDKVCYNDVKILIYF